MALTARELAEFIGAKLLGDDSVVLSGVASPESAGPQDLIYLDSMRYQDRAQNSAAKCVLAPLGLSLKNKTILEVENPKLAFAKASVRFLSNYAPPAGVHPSAIVASSARINPNVFIGPYVVIEDEVEIDEDSIVEAFCFLGRRSAIGQKCRLHPRVTLYPGAKLAARVEVHSGAVIGSDGFGYVFGDGRHWKFPQIGSVEIGDDVEVGSNSTIDRGSLGGTRISSGVKIDNLVQVAHNVSIGKHSLVAAQVGLADHCTIEDRAIVGAQAGVPTGKTIRQGQTVWGTPARPIEKYKKQYAAFARLPELLARVENIEKEKP